MDTTFTVKLIDVHKMTFVENHPSWDVTVVVEIASPFGILRLNVPISKAATLDHAVHQAIGQVGGWGSTFPELARHVFEVRPRS